MQKLFIKNRKNQNIAVIVEQAENQKWLAFVMHWLSWRKEEPHIELFAKVFKDNNYSVVRFDTTNTFGESDGDYADATVTNYYQDLEDVIDWAKEKEFYKEPFVLCWHSLGGICTTLYAQNNPEKIKALAPIATVVSWNLSKDLYSAEKLKNREETWWLTKPRSHGWVKKIKWWHMVDRLKYDLIPKANLLMIVGDRDDSTPPRHQQILFDAIPWENKELHIIKDAIHTFNEKENLDEIYTIFDKRIKNM